MFPPKKAKKALPSHVLEVDLDTIPSVRLRQLIAEVRVDKKMPPTRNGMYDRIHNRHNRS